MPPDRMAHGSASLRFRAQLTQQLHVLSLDSFDFDL
jgi:hypothetical protein